MTPYYCFTRLSHCTRDGPQTGYHGPMEPRWQVDGTYRGHNLLHSRSNRFDGVDDLDCHLGEVAARVYSIGSRRRLSVESALRATMMVVMNRKDDVDIRCCHESAGQTGRRGAVDARESHSFNRRLTVAILATRAKRKMMTMATAQWLHICPDVFGWVKSMRLRPTRVHRPQSAWILLQGIKDPKERLP